MSIGKAIYSILSNNGAVAALVGTKIFPARAEQGTEYPFIVYNTISTNPSNTYGASGKSTLDMVRVQITVLANTQAAIDNIASKIRIALDYYTVSAVVVAGVTISNIFFDEENDFFDNTAGQEGIYIKNQDYIISINL